MSEERFWVTSNPKYLSVVFDERQKKHYIGTDLEDLLNEQDEKIKVLQNSWEIMNRRISELYRSIRINDELDKEKMEALKDAETEIKLLNSYLVEKGLAEDYVKWKKQWE